MGGYHYYYLRDGSNNIITGWSQSFPNLDPWTTKSFPNMDIDTVSVSEVAQVSYVTLTTGFPLGKGVMLASFQEGGSLLWTADLFSIEHW